ncbi:hypothetical protein DVH05_002162 [Phytophthora capsici]|nr:hypothetical protein DVH05_002162 [Phytophthora capsici]
MDSSRRDVEPRIEFVPSRIPKLIAVSPQALQADILELAKALEHVNIQRKKLLSKSSSQPSIRLEPLEAKQANNCK